MNLATFVREYFEKPDHTISRDTKLFAEFGIEDPDYFSDFLEDFTNQYKIELPVVRNPQKYSEALEKENGGSFDILFRRITKTPIIFVEEITFQELCNIAELGKWPAKYVVAYEALE